MPSDLVMCVAFNIVASALSYIALGLSIASVAGNTWVRSTLEEKDLFNSYESILIPCTNNSTAVCVISNSGDDWIRAARAFMILMVVFTFLGCLANFGSQVKLNKSARQGSGTLWMMAAFFGLIGASVFQGVFSSRFRGVLIFSFENGLTSAWVAVGLNFVANICNYISGRYISDEMCQKKCRG